MVRVSRVVPKDWTRYSSIGQVIPRTRFIVFKTPLNDQLATKVPKDRRFNTTDLFRQLSLTGQHLGLVVDLTDTDRYYDKNDITGMCVEYEKINCPGRGFIDRDECMDSFTQAIQNYIDKCDDEEALIGVHCTNGVNRSGYLICRFLIERLGWSSHEALDAFEQARGYPIEKGDYVMALHKAAKNVKNEQQKQQQKQLDSDSDSSDRRRKSKKSKRKYREIEENTGGMSMIDALLGEINQQVTAAAQFENSPASNSEDTQAQPATHWGFAVKRTKYQSLNQAQQQGFRAEEENSPFVEDEAEGEFEDEEYEEVQGDDQIQSASSKRRARRSRMNKMLAVMKRGKYHEIQAMQEEMAISHGNARNI